MIWRKSIGLRCLVTVRKKALIIFLFITISVNDSPFKTNHTVTCWFFDKIVVNWSISINWGDDEKMAELDRILNPFVNYIIQFLEEYGIFMDCLYDY